MGDRQHRHRALREVIRHPALDLVGVLVYDPEKDGVDAGTLCGEEPVGVRATTDRAAIRDLAADCVLYMPRIFDLDDVVALLESGTNIVTTRGELFGGGHRLGDADRARVLDACHRGGSSIYATGSSPGFITEVLPFALLSLQRHVESIEIEEFADLSQRDSPHMLFEQMGFGRPIESFNKKRSSYLLGEFRPSLELVADAAGRPVDEWTCAGEVAVAHDDVAGRGQDRGGIDRRAADDHRGAERRCRRRSLHGELVLHHRCRAGVGPPADGLAGAGARRRAARRRPGVPDAARGARLGHTRVHREPTGQRRPLRVCGAARDPPDRGSGPDYPRRAGCDIGMSGEPQRIPSESDASGAAAQTRRDDMSVFSAFRYDGKRALVVGGASGMGAAVAELVQDAGAEVVAMDFAEVKLPGAKAIHVNLADQASIDAAVDECGGPVHALFSCAGVADGTPGIEKINFIGHRYLIDLLLTRGVLTRGPRSASSRRRPVSAGRRTSRS